MTLRLRLALAAGVAVTLAVLAVTITAYAGTKSELRGQLDRELTGLVTRAGPPRRGPTGLGPPGPPGALPFGPGAGNRGEPPGVGDEGLALERRGAGFGGPAGLITLIHRDGTVFVPPTQSRRIPVDAGMRAVGGDRPRAAVQRDPPQRDASARARPGNRARRGDCRGAADDERG